METELFYLALSLVLYFVMIVVGAAGNAKSYSLKFLIGPRDGIEDKTIFKQRAVRANANMAENLILFGFATVIAVVTENTSELTALGAMLFFYGRLVFAPTYWLGLPWVRTIAWFVALIGTLMILWELFF